MKIAFITTINTNVGDDFVREGIKFLIERIIKLKKIKYTYIDKSAPITSRYGFEWIQNMRIYKTKLDRILPLGLTRDKIIEADLVIQSGAPVYWCHQKDNIHCYNTLWFEDLIKRRFFKNNNARFLNIAAGTIQKYNSNGSDFCEKCLNYTDELHEISIVTTVRDFLAKKVLKSIGIHVPLIPCTSIFAKNYYNIHSNQGEYVVLNYMEGGGHYNFSNEIDKMRWENLFIKFYNFIKNKENVVFVCHNKNEVKYLKKLLPDAKFFYSKYFIEYIKFYSKARFGIVNRVHSAFMLASFGKPSIVIGNDSRAKMTDEIGLENIFVNDVSFDYLLENYNKLKKIEKTYIDKFIVIKEKAIDDYSRVLYEKLNIL